MHEGSAHIVVAMVAVRVFCMPILCRMLVTVVFVIVAVTMIVPMMMAAA